MKDPKLRFSNRAAEYANYRPGYTREILSFLEEKCDLTNDSVVADVGSGTGILSKLLLHSGNRVLGIEPNDEMREAAEGLLGHHPRFESVAGAAEATTLANGSVVFIIAGNSFHWFDHHAARAEFLRVLKPSGRVAIVWNVRRKTGVPFLEDLERLLSEHRVDDSGVEAASYKNIYERTEAFFGAGGFETTRFPTAQSLDFEGLKGLVLSYSSMPAEGEPGSGAMLHDLEGVFRANESGGQVTMEYVVRVYCGSLR
jgi:SAM-dependent methyltransferase